MDAGKLDQRILIETPTYTTDELGAEAATWSEHSRPWAQVKETLGREFLAGDVQTERKAVFRIRWRAVDARARVTWRGRIYGLDDVTGTEREGWAYLHGRTNSGEK